MYLWTSEAVAAGHPDKVADQIADAILDAYLTVDPEARVASEVTILNNFVLLSGEINSRHEIDVIPVVRKTICDIGYDRLQNSFDGNTCEIVNKISKQSPEIAAAVIHSDGIIGAGDQGLMFGFASNYTPTYMPLAHHLAFQIINLLAQERRKEDTPFLPDAKAQVTVAYSDNQTYIHTVVISTCHKPAVGIDELRKHVDRTIITALKASDLGWMFNEKTRWLINPAGQWNVGGPASDTGLSGRKIVVDNYGADCPIGGGSFSGKDPTKVDRSGAYAARHIAKNIVAAKLANEVKVQISYAIGVAEPTSLNIHITEPANIDCTNDLLMEMVRSLVDLTPQGIINRFNLRTPIYGKTASGGHFGREEFPWEKLDFVEDFKKYCEGVIEVMEPMAL